jgi:hypothetical protein
MKCGRVGLHQKSSEQFHFEISGSHGDEYEDGWFSKGL